MGRIRWIKEDLRGRSFWILARQYSVLGISSGALPEAGECRYVFLPCCCLRSEDLLCSCGTLAIHLYSVLTGTHTWSRSSSRSAIGAVKDKGSDTDCGWSISAGTKHRPWVPRFYGHVASSLITTFSGRNKLLKVRGSMSRPRLWRIRTSMLCSFCLTETALSPAFSTLVLAPALSEATYMFGSTWLYYSGAVFWSFGKENQWYPRKARKNPHLELSSGSLNRSKATRDEKRRNRSPRSFHTVLRLSIESSRSKERTCSRYDDTLSRSTGPIPASTVILFHEFVLTTLIPILHPLIMFKWAASSTLLKNVRLASIRVTSRLSPLE